MNAILFIIGSLAHLFIKWLDIKSSRECKALGMKERTPWFRDENGQFSEPKAWFAVGLWTAIGTGLYIFARTGEYWHPLYSLGVYAGSAIASFFAYRNNLNKIRYVKERQL